LSGAFIPLAKWVVLTYKTTSEAINALEGTALRLLVPLFGDEENPRAVYVSEEVYGIVKGSMLESWDDERHASLRALLDDFVAGTRIAVAEAPYSNKGCATLARVDPVEAEIWDIRCLDPYPGIRVFGRFAAKDTFIALTWDYRENFEGGVYWANEVARCTDAWESLFGTLSPLKGNSLNDYLSHNFYAV